MILATVRYFMVFLTAFVFLQPLTLSPAHSLLAAAESPNVLIIMADDCTFSDLPLR